MPPSTQWLIISLHPDVCVTNGVPVPYVVVSEPQLADLHSGNVAFNGCLTMTFDSVTTACRGDEAGDGGVRSGVVGDVCDPVEECETVHINGAGAVGEGDLFHMNRGNTLGKVVVVPAIAHPDSPDALGDAEFDRAVSNVIVDMLRQTGGDTGEAATRLFALRNGGMAPPWGPVEPEVYNNPVIVAAEHYFVAYNMGASKAARLMVSAWENAKAVPVLNVVVDESAKWWYGINQDHPPSDHDPRVKKWSNIGTRMSTKGRLGISATAVLLNEATSPPPRCDAGQVPPPGGTPTPAPAPGPVAGPTPATAVPGVPTAAPSAVPGPAPG